MVETSWNIGRESVEEEQYEEIRAQYGKGIIKNLSKELSLKYGQEDSLTNLKE